MSKLEVTIVHCSILHGAICRSAMSAIMPPGGYSSRSSVSDRSVLFPRPKCPKTDSTQACEAWDRGERKFARGFGMGATENRAGRALSAAQTAT